MKIAAALSRVRDAARGGLSWAPLVILLSVSLGCGTKSPDGAQTEAKSGDVPPGDAGRSNEPRDELPLDIPPALTGVWIAHLDGSKAVIRTMPSLRGRSDRLVQLWHKLPPEQALGARLVDQRLACLNKSGDLGSRLPAEFTPGQTLTLHYAGGSQQATVRALNAQCERGRMEVELELPIAIETPPDGPRFGVLLVGEAAKRGQQFRHERIVPELYSEEFKPWDDAIARVVHEDFEALRGKEEERFGRKFDLDEAATAAEYWATSEQYMSWRVPSAQVEVALLVRQGIDGLSTSMHLLTQIYALRRGGQVLRASRPVLHDDAEIDRRIYAIGTIDLDGDGNEELLLSILSYDRNDDEPMNETDAETWFGLLYYDRENGRFEGVKLSGGPEAWYGDRIFDHP